VPLSYKNPNTDRATQWLSVNDNSTTIIIPGAASNDWVLVNVDQYSILILIY